MLTKRAIAGREFDMQICGVDVTPGSGLDRVLGAIAGVSMGDRLGLPAETMTHEAIMARTGGKGIDRYFDANEWRTDATAWGPFGPTGSASDDLACTLALMEAIADNRGVYDPERSAEALLKAAKETKMAGWGGSMKYGARRLQAGRWDGNGRLTTVRSWMARPSDAPGTGDGVMMRISPLGLKSLIRDTETLPEMVFHVFEEARLTHGHPIAAVGAALVTMAIANAAHTERGLRALQNFALMTLEMARRVVDTRLYDTEAYDEGVGGYGGRFAPCLREWGDGWHMAIDDMYQAFERVAAIPPADIEARGAQAIAEVTGLQSHSLQAAPFTLAMAFRDISPEQALLETVNAGGDTDTFGAIVMSIVGAREGVTGLPRRFLMPEDCPLVVREHEALGPRVKRFVEACQQK